MGLTPACELMLTTQADRPRRAESRNAARNHAEGLALPEDTRADLHRLAEETGITPGW